MSMETYHSKYHKPNIVRCPQCGTEVNIDETKYCPKCGYCLRCEYE